VDILSIDALSDAEIAEIFDRSTQYFEGNRGRRANERLPVMSMRIAGQRLRSGRLR
jgi:hypothetical protein